MRAWEKPGDKISNRMEELSKVKHMKGSVNKWTAHAPNAMAMLWVASIGKYRTIQLDGIVGIPDVKVDAYYAKASAAADAVINSQTKHFIRIGAQATGATGFNYSDQIMVTTP